MTVSKPIIPTEDMTLYQRQRCGQRFHGEVLKAMNPLIRGTAWKRKSAWLFKIVDNCYITAFITGGSTPDGMDIIIRADLGFKPMSVDPIHWRALGLHDNLKEPNSFRSCAAWKVPALPFAKQEWSKGLTNIEETSQLPFQEIENMAGSAQQAFVSKPFSKLLAEHEYSDRYLALKWASMIAEGHGSLALEEIKKHYIRSGQSIEASSAAKTIVKGYQNVISGTDKLEYRHLSADLDGNLIVKEPFLSLVAENKSSRPNFLIKFLSLFRDYKK